MSTNELKQELRDRECKRSDGEVVPREADLDRAYGLAGHSCIWPCESLVCMESGHSIALRLLRFSNSIVPQEDDAARQRVLGSFDGHGNWWNQCCP